MSIQTVVERKFAVVAEQRNNALNECVNLHGVITEMGEEIKKLNEQLALFAPKDDGAPKAEHISSKKKVNHGPAN